MNVSAKMKQRKASFAFVKKNIFTAFIKQTKLYLLKIPNRISSPSSSIFETVCLIIYEISVSVAAGNRETIMLVTNAS